MEDEEYLENPDEAIERIVRELGIMSAMHDAAVSVYVRPLAELLVRDPDKGLDKIFEVYDKGLDFAYENTATGKNNRSYIESVAGGPCEIVPAAIYNAVGAVYPRLDRNQKDKALKNILGILDKLNYRIVQNFHTNKIREPLLLSDIQIVYRSYWPGLDEGEAKLKKYDSFSDLKFDLMDEKGLFDPMKVDSDFVMAYSLLRSDFCDYGEEYIESADKALLYRTMKGIVAMRFARADNECDVRKGMARLQELLPKSLHPRIDPLRNADGWADVKKFR